MSGWASAGAGMYFSDNADERTWARRWREIEAISRLGDDWDGEGARAPTAAILNTARRLLGQMSEDGDTAPSSITVSSDGTVIIAWKRLGAYREAEVERAGIASWMERQAGVPTKHWTTRVVIDVPEYFSARNDEVQGWERETSWQSRGLSVAV